jgi:hypothetical protein
MPQYTYKLQIDFGHGGLYAHALADVTARLMDGDLRYGMNEPYQEIANASSLSFRLQNHDNALTPDNTAGAYYGLLTKGTLVKFTATYAGTTYISWTGKVAKIMPRVEQNADPQNNAYVQVVVEDPMNELLAGQIFPQLQTNVTVNTALATMLNSSDMPVIYPYASYWNVIGVSVIGTAKILGQDLFTSVVSTRTLPYVGDNMSDALNSVGMKSFIDDVVKAELGGRFFWNGSQFEFQDRYYATTTLNGAISLTLDSNDLMHVDYRDNEDVMNDATVTCQPRAVGSAGTIIYSAPRTISLAAGQSTDTVCHYRDATAQNARIGASVVIDPVSGTDYIANSASDGSGSSLTSYISVTIVKKAQSAVVTLRNSGTTDAYITTLQLRGTPLYTFERQTVRATDAQSINDYGRYPKTYNLKLIADIDTALGYAQTQVARFKDPIARFQSVTYVASDSLKLLTADIDIGNLITINDSVNTKANRDYTIVGVMHHVDAAKREHTTMLTLSPIANEAYWVLGQVGSSELGSTAIVAL